MAKKFEGSGRKVDLGGLPPPRVIRVKPKSVAAEGPDDVVGHGNKHAVRVHTGKRSRKVKARKPTRNEQVMAQHPREKPTPEQVAGGVYALVEGERFNTKQLDERLLVNLASRGRGAATMYARGQISRREYMAAEALCELAETAGASQLTGGGMSERVDGGKIDLEGNRLRAAGQAYGEYREALERLTRAGRVLVENVVVAGMPMQDAVKLRNVAHRLDALKSLDMKRNRAVVILSEALDTLADYFHIATA